MSVMNPGVSRSAPPRMIAAPSKTSARDPALLQRVVEAGARPPGSASAGARRRGGCRGSAARSLPGRDLAAHLDDHVELRDRDDDEEVQGGESIAPQA